MFGRAPSIDSDNNVPSGANKQTFNIKNLSTKSVTLYPTRAHVVREIQQVALRPGTNEVEIRGLSPTVDEQSIQIEGQGPATIVDMTVQLVPNHDIFEETYPEDEETDEDDEEPQESETEDSAVEDATRELKNLKSQITKTTETQNSANERLATWDRYAKSANAEHLSPNDISKLLQKYEEDRSAIFDVYSTATQELAELKRRFKKKERERERLEKEAKKHKEKANKQQAKEQQHKVLRRAEKRKEARYLRQERLRYWPKKVYKITLLLEGTSLDTPGSSRRNSIDSVTLASPRLDVAKTEKSIEAEQTTAVALVLSYVTKEAGWSPRYDLRISSVQKSATIIYRAEFLNRTSEEWKDAKLSFSTSQTSYQGLDDTVPFMHAWRIKLSRYDDGDGSLLSPEELYKPRTGRPGFDTFNRSEYFGLDDAFIPAWQSKRPLQVQQYSTGGGLFGSTHKTGGLFGGSTNPNVLNKVSSFGQQNTSNTGGGLFGSANNSNAAPVVGGLFGSTNNNNAAPVVGGLFGAPSASKPAVDDEQKVEAVEKPIGQANAALGLGSARGSNVFSSRMSSGLFGSRRKKSNAAPNPDEANDDPNDYDLDVAELEEQDLDFEENTWEDNGLTATYDVPGTRTLEPSSLTRRHKLATLHAVNISLSHICVPKLRSAAFLRAKIRNPSPLITLLKGSAGVTLDGSFLGNMSLPRVSPNQVFDLSLGVDPSIHVNYPKPSVHRSTQGIVFNKESAQVFSRSVWINNTKSQSVDLQVLDQVPVSEDERLRIIISTPKGLVKEGDEVRAGMSAKEGSGGAVAEKKGEGWGNAKAKLKKNGQVDWTVKLEKGQGCLLKLEYEARLPPSERIVPA